MHDPDSVAAFEECSLPPAGLSHRAHVRLAWIYLREHPLPQALNRFSTGLKRYAASLGASAKYHETITWAYLFLVHQRIAIGPADETWQEFSVRNPDLMTWRPSILAGYYRDETLTSELAKRVFVLPDRSGPDPQPRNA